MPVARFLNNRPLTVIGLIVSFRAAVTGIGFILQSPDIVQTMLHQNVANLIDPPVFGIVLLIVGVFTMLAFAKGNDKIVDLGCTLQSLAWLFAAILYALSGAWILFLSIGVPFCLISGYIGYVFRTRYRWLDS